jgi:hypothetical protein
MCCILALVAVVPAFAQDETFGLSEADFALFTEANAASAEFDTLSYDFELNVTATGMGADDVNIALTGSGVLGEQDGAPLFSLDVSGDIGSGSDTMTVDFEARMVDNMIYFNLGDGSGWQGGELSALMNSMGSMFGGMVPGMPMDPSQMTDPDAMTDAMGEMMAMPGMMEAMMAMSTLDAGEYVNITRTDGDGSATFTVDINVADLLTSEEMGAVFGAVMAGQMGGSSAEMDEAQMAQMGAMMGMMFSDLTVNFAQTVNTSTNLVERAEFNLDFPVPAMMSNGADANLNLMFAVDLSGYNEPISVEAPAEFTDLGAAA